MANLQSAKKKVRKDITRTRRNDVYRSNIDKTMRNMKSAHGESALKGLLQKAYSLIDKAAKRKIIHKNKAARLKSRVTNLTRSKA